MLQVTGAEVVEPVQRVVLELAHEHVSRLGTRRPFATLAQRVARPSVAVFQPVVGLERLHGRRDNR